MGVAYDLFGNGKTAVKVNLGKFPNAFTNQEPDFDLNPLARITLYTTRSWADADRDYVPDCDLTNRAGNGECGPMADQNFGKNVFTQTWDPEFIHGWGKRPYNWEMGLAVQHEIVPRVALNAGYYRRWFGNFYVNDNRLVGPGDFDQFTITVNDPRLPGGSSTFTGIDVKPGKFGLVDNFRTASSNFGKQIEYWHGVDVTVDARLAGFTLRGGTSTGRRVTDACGLVAEVPEALFTLGTIGATTSTTTTQQQGSYCRQVASFLTKARGLVTYTIPRVDVQASMTYMSDSGTQILANYNAPNAVVAPSLGRSLSGGASTTPINLVQPGTLRGPRINQMDFRFMKLLRFGRTRTQVGIDIYNATNTAVPRTFNQTFVPGGAWQAPLSILQARWVKFTAQFDF